MYLIQAVVMCLVFSIISSTPLEEPVQRINEDNRLSEDILKGFSVMKQSSQKVPLNGPSLDKDVEDRTQDGSSENDTSLKPVNELPLTETEMTTEEHSPKMIKESWEFIEDPRIVSALTNGSGKEWGLLRELKRVQQLNRKLLLKTLKDLNRSSVVKAKGSSAQYMNRQSQPKDKRYIDTLASGLIGGK